VHDERNISRQTYIHNGYTCRPVFGEHGINFVRFKKAPNAFGLKVLRGQSQ
jgi:hypothetical protein